MGLVTRTGEVGESHLTVNQALRLSRFKSYVRDIGQARCDNCRLTGHSFSHKRGD